MEAKMRYVKEIRNELARIGAPYWEVTPALRGQVDIANFWSAGRYDARKVLAALRTQPSAPLQTDPERIWAVLDTVQ